MSNSEELLPVVRELEPQLPVLLGEKATEAQQQIKPLIEQLAAGQSDGADLLKVLRTYPAVAEALQQKLDLPQPVDEHSLEELLRDRSYNGLPGKPSSAIPGQRYICPVPDCGEPPWFRRGSQSPRICEEHGVVMVPATGEG